MNPTSPVSTPAPGDAARHGGDRGPPPFRLGVICAFAFAYAVLYVALDRVSYVYPILALNITPWNPPAALAVGLLMVRGFRWLPVVYLTIVVADLVVRGPPSSIELGLALPLFQAGGWAAIAATLRGPLALTPGLSRQPDLLKLVATCTIGAALIGALSVAALAVGEALPSAQLPDAFIRYWIGDTLGLIVMLPLVLLLLHVPRRRELWQVTLASEFLVQIAVILAIIVYIFGYRSVEAFRHFYLLFLPLIWVAVRHRFAGAVLAVAVVQVGLVVAVVAADYRALTVVEVQALMLSLALTGLFLGMAVDQWKTASHRLERTRRLAAAGEVATGLAHELNQPLAALSAYADAVRMQLAREPSDHEAAIATVAHIRRLATRASGIVKRFRELGQAEPLTAPTDISVPIASAIAHLRERAHDEHVRLTTRMPSPPPIVRMDVDRITLVFENLISNAIDAAAASPASKREVTIGVRIARRGIVHVTIEDTGTGIEADEAERIFEPFRTSKTGGLGLGLPISRSIVEAHGGAIWACAARHGIIELWLPT